MIGQAEDCCSSLSESYLTTLTPSTKWLAEHSISNHAGGYSIVEFAFLLDVQKKKETYSAAQRSSAEGKEALEAFVGGCLEQVPPPDPKDPSSVQNPALSTFVHLSLVNVIFGACCIEI